MGFPMNYVGGGGGGGAVKINGVSATAKCLNAIQKGDFCEFIPSDYSISNGFSAPVVNNIEWSGSTNYSFVGNKLCKVTTISGELYLLIYKNQGSTPNNWLAALLKFSSSGVSVVGAPVTFITGSYSAIGPGFVLSEIAPNEFLLGGVYSSSDNKFYYNFITVNFDNTITVSGNFSELVGTAGLSYFYGMYGYYGFTQISENKLAVIYYSSSYSLMAAVFQRSGNTLSRLGAVVGFAYSDYQPTIDQDNIIKVGNNRFAVSYEQTLNNSFDYTSYRQLVYLLSFDGATNSISIKNKELIIRENDGTINNSGFKSIVRLYEIDDNKFGYVSAQIKRVHPSRSPSQSGPFFFFGGHINVISGNDISIDIPPGNSDYYVEIFKDWGVGGWGSLSLNIKAFAVTSDFMVYCGQDNSTALEQHFGYCGIEKETGRALAATVQRYLNVGTEWAPLFPTMIDRSGIYSIRDRKYVYRFGISDLPNRVSKFPSLTNHIRPAIALKDGILDSEIPVMYKQ